MMCMCKSCFFFGDSLFNNGDFNYLYLKVYEGCKFIVIFCFIEDINFDFIIY